MAQAACHVHAWQVSHKAMGRNGLVVEYGVGRSPVEVECPKCFVRENVCLGNEAGAHENRRKQKPALGMPVRRRSREGSTKKVPLSSELPRKRICLNKNEKEHVVLCPVGHPRQECGE